MASLFMDVVILVLSIQAYVKSLDVRHVVFRLVIAAALVLIE